MLALGPPRFLLTPLHHLRIFVSPCFRTPLPPLIKVFYFHSSSRPIAKITSMAGTAAASAAGEHVTGNWFSVPDLRLRDHRFTIPLDHSLNDLTSLKISVFAREVVAGKLKELNLRNYQFRVNFKLAVCCFSYGVCDIFFLLL